MEGGGHFLGREVALWDIPTSTAAATTGAAMLSPTFSGALGGS